MDTNIKESSTAHHLAVVMGIALSALVISGIGLLSKKQKWMMVEMPNGTEFSILTGVSGIVSIVIILFGLLYAMFALAALIQHRS